MAYAPYEDELLRYSASAPTAQSASDIGMTILAHVVCHGSRVGTRVHSGPRFIHRSPSPFEEFKQEIERAAYQRSLEQFYAEN